jgi:FkbM family methyltransferase
VDGGAHVGLYTVIAAKVLRGEGRVISFEPDPRNYELLKRNILLNGVHSMVRPEPLAITDSEGVMGFWSSPHQSTCGSLVPLENESDMGIPVKCTSLDQYIRSNAIDQIHVLKLDLEGAEPACLQGMDEAVKQLRCLMLEINLVRLQAQTIDPIEFVEHVQTRGRFRTVYVCDEHAGNLVPWDNGKGIKQPLSQFGYANIIFHRDVL